MKSAPSRTVKSDAASTAPDSAGTSGINASHVARFEELAAMPEDRIDVALGFALVAKDVYANLDVGALLARFDELAKPLEGLGLRDASPKEQVTAISHHLFRQLGFRGNEGDYEDPKNSLRPDVLDRKLGIPITLALVYCEVAKRVGVPAYGVGFPAHFLIGIEQPRALGASTPSSSVPAISVTSG